MSCDIRAVIEILDDPNCPWPWADLKLPRDYALFAALAGVRGQPNERHLFPPRGLPAKRSYVIHDYFFHRVVEDVDANSRLNRGEDFVTRSEADELVQRGLAYYIPTALGEPNGFVSKNEWHTPSWLTFPEILEALDYANLKMEDRSVEFRAALCAMENLAKSYGKDSIRLVFWFDS